MLVFVTITIVDQKLIKQTMPLFQTGVVVLCCATVISKHSVRHGKCGLLEPFPSCMPNTQLHTSFAKCGVCLTLCLFHGDLIFQKLLNQPFRIVDLLDSLRAVLEERDFLMLVSEMAPQQVAAVPRPVTARLCTANPVG